MVFTRISDGDVHGRTVSFRGGRIYIILAFQTLNKNPKSFVSEHLWFNPLSSLLFGGCFTTLEFQWHPMFSQDSRTVWKVLQPVRLNKSGEGNGWVTHRLERMSYFVTPGFH